MLLLIILHYIDVELENTISFIYICERMRVRLEGAHTVASSAYVSNAMI